MKSESDIRQLTESAINDLRNRLGGREPRYGDDIDECEYRCRLEKLPKAWAAIRKFMMADDDPETLRSYARRYTGRGVTVGETYEFLLVALMFVDDNHQRKFFSIVRWFPGNMVVGPPGGYPDWMDAFISDIATFADKGMTPVDDAVINRVDRFADDHADFAEESAARAMAKPDGRVK